MVSAHTNRFSVHMKLMIAKDAVETVANMIARTSTLLVAKTVIKNATTNTIRLFHTLNQYT
jgi:hypothetical protein